MDFMPTALEAAEIDAPNNLDGVSLLPYLTGKSKAEPHKYLTWVTSYTHWFDEENIPFWDGYHKLCVMNPMNILKPKYRRS